MVILIKGFGIISRSSRKAEKSRILGWTLLGPAVLLVLLLCHSWFGPDIWYHLTWGRSLLENLSFLPTTRVLLVQPIYANMYWLFQISVYGLMKLGGIVLVSALFLGLWMAIAYLWLRETQASRSPFYGVVLFLAFIVCAQLRFEARPEIFSYLFLALEITLLGQLKLEKQLAKPIALAIFLVQVLWTNCHGYFALGPLLGVAMVTACIWERRFGKPLVRAGMIFGVLLAGSFISPFGWESWRAVFVYTEVSRALRELNQELLPPTLLPLYWPITVFWLYWLLATGWSGFLAFKRKESFAAFLCLGGSLLAVQATRNIPMFLILSGPAIGNFLIFSKRYTPARAFQYLPQLISLVLAVLVVRGDYHRSTSSLGSFGIHLESSAYPLGGVEFLKQMRFSGKIFCDSYDGGYVEYQLPGVLISGDSYFSDAPTTLTFFAAIKNPEALRSLTQRFEFDALLINVENQEVMDSLWSDVHWKLAYADSHRTLFLRRPQYDYVSFNLEKVRFFEGEDLTHWTYTFGVVTWAGMALKNHNVVLMKKIVSDLGSAPHVPATLIKYALLLAGQSHDKELLDQTLPLTSKMFADQGELSEVSAVAERARAAF